MDRSNRTQQEEENRRQGATRRTDERRKFSSPTINTDNETHANEDYLKEKDCSEKVREEVRDTPTPD